MVMRKVECIESRKNVGEGRRINGVQRIVARERK
jgi:hypothetical protein